MGLLCAVFTCTSSLASIPPDVRKSVKHICVSNMEPLSVFPMSYGVLQSNN